MTESTASLKDPNRRTMQVGGALIGGCGSVRPSLCGIVILSVRKLYSHLAGIVN